MNTSIFLMRGVQAPREGVREQSFCHQNVWGWQLKMLKKMVLLLINLLWEGEWEAENGYVSARVHACVVA